MTAAGRSARREYERRLRIDHDRRRVDLPPLLPRLVLGSVAAFVFLRIGLGVVGAWITHHYELPLATAPRAHAAGVPHTALLLDAVSFAIALAVGVLGVSALWSRRQSTEAWRRGAEGEEQVGRALDRLAGEGLIVRHDLAIARSRANIDHVVATREGVFAIDTKNFRGTLTLSGSTLLQGSRALTTTIESSRWQADHVSGLLHTDDSLPVHPIVCVLGASLPARRLELQGVIVVEGTAELIREIGRRRRSRLTDSAYSVRRDTLAGLADRS